MVLVQVTRGSMLDMCLLLGTHRYKSLEYTEYPAGASQHRGLEYNRTTLTPTTRTFLRGKVDPKHIESRCGSSRLGFWHNVLASSTSTYLMVAS